MKNLIDHDVSGTIDIDILQAGVQMTLGKFNQVDDNYTVDVDVCDDTPPIIVSQSSGVVLSRSRGDYSTSNPKNIEQFEKIVRVFSRSNFLKRVETITSLMRSTRTSIYAVLASINYSLVPDNLFDSPLKNTTNSPISNDKKAMITAFINMFSPTTIYTIYAEGGGGIVSYIRKGIKNIVCISTIDYNCHEIVTNKFVALAARHGVKVTSIRVPYTLAEFALLQIDEFAQSVKGVVDDAVLISVYFPQFSVYADLFKGFYSTFSALDVADTYPKISLPPRLMSSQLDQVMLANWSVFHMQDFDYTSSRQWFDPDRMECVFFSQHGCFRDTVHDSLDYLYDPRFRCDVVSQFLSRSSKWKASFLMSVPQDDILPEFTCISQDCTYDVTNFYVPVEGDMFAPAVVTYSREIKCNTVSTKYPFYCTYYFCRDTLGREVFVDCDRYNITYVEKRKRMMLSGHLVIPLSSSPVWQVNWPISPTLISIPQEFTYNRSSFSGVSYSNLLDYSECSSSTYKGVGVNKGSLVWDPSCQLIVNPSLVDCRFPRSNITSKMSGFTFTQAVKWKVIGNDPCICVSQSSSSRLISGFEELFRGISISLPDREFLCTRAEWLGFPERSCYGEEDADYSFPYDYFAHSEENISDTNFPMEPG